MNYYRIILISLCFTFIECSNEKNYLPVQINSFKLNRTLTGAEAEAFIDRLHQGKVASEKNEIGFYKLDNSSLIIYVAYYKDAGKAVSEYEKMIAGLSLENSVFINPGYVNINNKQIYSCSGLGQSHFVFHNRKQLIWLSVDSHIGKDFLEKYLEHIN